MRRPSRPGVVVPLEVPAGCSLLRRQEPTGLWLRARLALLILITACGTSEPSSNAGPLVVRAQLAAGQDSQFVDVGQAATVARDFVPPMLPESNASVILHGPADRWVLTEISPGRYACACHVIPGTRYSVDVRTVGNESAHGVTHVPPSPEVSPADTSLAHSNAIAQISWRPVSIPGQYGIYHGSLGSPLRASFLQYTPDTTLRIQPLGWCSSECCIAQMLMVVAFSPSIMTERGFPMPPGLSDTLVGALGVVGSATADSAIFHLDGAGPC